MAVSVMRLAWQSGNPPTGKVVEVWFINSIILATWNGSEWLTADGDKLEGVSHWRYRL